MVVNVNTKSAERQIQAFSKKINTLYTNFNRIASAGNNVTRPLKTANTHIQKNVSKTQSWADKMKSVRKEAFSTNNAFTKIGSSLKKIAATYLTFQTVKTGLGAATTITSAENRLNSLEGGSPEATAKAMDKIYSAAQRSRTAYGDMLSNVSKTMTLAGDSFKGDIDNAIRFQEIMAKSYALGGASSTEASTSMYQLVQALGSGVLQGDELRSVREGAPLAYKQIEKFAQGVYNTEESLKDLASQGKITSDMVVSAIMGMGDTVDKQFENTQMTFSQAWDNMKTTALRAFQPVLQKLTDILNSDVGQRIISGITTAIIVCANAVSWLLDIFVTFFNWCVENWSWLKYVVLGVISALIAAWVIYTGITIAQALIRFAMWAVEYWWILLIVAAVGLLVAGIVWLANTTASGAEFICTALMWIAIVVVAVGTVIALVTGNIVVLVIGLILAAIALIVTCLANWGEEIMGIIYTVGAFIYNLVVGLINGILQTVFHLVEPIASIVEWIYNAFNGGFNGIGGACANLVGQMISWFLSLGKVVTKIVDAIFGTDWTSGLNALQDKVLAWGKNEDALTIDRDITVQKIAGKFGVDLPDRIAYGDAYAKGAEVGRGIENKIESIGSSLKNGISNFGNLDKLTGKDLGKFTATDGYLANGLPNVNDPAYDVSGAWKEPDVDDLLNGVDSINDNMSLADDDLEYLRKIAEMEWRNEFTTAEIRVDMTNNNTVNGERDLDGIVSYLADTLREEMTNVAYGVHY